jgi:hypothetical protein
MFSVKLKVKEQRSNSLPRRRRVLSPTSSISSSTSSLSRISQGKVPQKSSFLNKNNGKSNKRVRIQTEYETSNSNSNHYNNGYGRCIFY